MAGDVLCWNSGGPAGESFVIAVRFVRRELALGMRIEIGPVTVERKNDEQFGVHARGRDAGSCQPFDRRVQSLAKLHESLSPRRRRATEKNNERKMDVYKGQVRVDSCLAQTAAELCSAWTAGGGCPYTKTWTGEGAH